MFHLACSISPFHNLYEHGRLVRWSEHHFSYIAAQICSAVFYYYIGLSLSINLSYVFLSLHVPHYASMKETQAERKKGMMSIGQTVMLKTSAVKLITHYFAGLRRQTGLSYILPLSVVKFTFNRLLDTAHPRRCIEVLRMPFATFLAASWPSIPYAVPFISAY